MKRAERKGEEGKRRRGEEGIDRIQVPLFPSSPLPLFPSSALFDGILSFNPFTHRREWRTLWPSHVRIASTPST
jgi:hypothetical protein